MIVNETFDPVEAEQLETSYRAAKTTPFPKNKYDTEKESFIRAAKTQQSQVIEKFQTEITKYVVLPPEIMSYSELLSIKVPQIKNLNVKQDNQAQQERPRKQQLQFVHKADKERKCINILGILTILIVISITIILSVLLSKK
jgi:hypothetical protein